MAIENLPNEEWKPITGFETLYEVSNMGRVRSFPRVCWNGKVEWVNPGRLMQFGDNGRGYKFLPLCYGKKRYKNAYIHRLVALHFIHNDAPDTRSQVNHKDGVKSNNKADNLEWCTQAENTRHGWDTGLFEASRFAAIHSAKSVPCEMVESGTGRVVATFPSVNSGLRSVYGGSRTCPSRSAGQISTYGGLYPHGTKTVPNAKRSVFFRKVEG